MKGIFVVGFMALTASAFAQEVPASEALPANTKEVLRQVVEEPARPEPIQFRVRKTQTKRIDVKWSPPMPGLPPVQGTVNLTTQKVDDPGLIPPRRETERRSEVEEAQGLTPEATAKWQEYYEKVRTLSLSATTYDRKKTHLRGKISRKGEVIEEFEAWAEIDWNLLAEISLGDHKLNGIDYNLMIGFGNIDTERWADFPMAKEWTVEIPDHPPIPPRRGFVFVEGGGPEAESTMFLSGIYQYYRRNLDRLRSAYDQKQEAYAQKKAELMANPPEPKNITIRHWRVQK